MGNSNYVGAPGMIRTCDPRFRKPVLYPTELRGLGVKVLTVLNDRIVAQVD